MGKKIDELKKKFNELMLEYENNRDMSVCHNSVPISSLWFYSDGAKELEEIGVEIGSGSVVCTLPVEKIPDGWRFVYDKREPGWNVYDEHDNLRAFIEVMIRDYCIYLKADVLTRYDITCYPNSDGVLETKVVDRKDLYCREVMYEDVGNEKGRARAAAWLNEHYPNWRDTNAYWRK